ncbi:MAG: ankyrin repeat domain-containing protein [Gammaproteobacteria bacterium]
MQRSDYLDKLRLEIQKARDANFLEGIIPEVFERDLESIEAALQMYITPEPNPSAKKSKQKSSIKPEIKYVPKHGLQTFLHIAAFRGYEHAVNLLVPDINKINAKDSLGHTPLYHAVQGAHIYGGVTYERIVTTLLENKADPDLANKEGKTPYSVAQTYKMQRLLPLLQKQHKDKEVKALDKSKEVMEIREIKKIDEEKESKDPLLQAIENDDLETVKQHLKKMDWTSIKLDHGSLKAAIAKQKTKKEPDTRIIKLLLDNDFDPTTRLHNYEGKSALHFAASCQSDAILRALFARADANIDVNQLSLIDNQSALQIAAKHGRLANVVYLINRGANPFVQTEQQTIFELFADHGEIDKLIAQLDMFAEHKNEDKKSSQSILGYLFQRYSEDKSDKEMLKKMIFSTAVLYPNQTYKCFRDLDIELSKSVPKAQQLRLLDLAATLKPLLNLRVKYRNKIRFFKYPFGELLNERIHELDPNREMLKKLRS